MIFVSVLITFLIFVGLPLFFLVRAQRRNPRGWKKFLIFFFTGFMLPCWVGSLFVARARQYETATVETERARREALTPEGRTAEDTAARASAAAEAKANEAKAAEELRNKAESLRTAMCRAAIKDAAHDPESVEFLGGNQKQAKDGTWIVQQKQRARNGFGALRIGWAECRVTGKGISVRQLDTD